MLRVWSSGYRVFAVRWRAWSSGFCRIEILRNAANPHPKGLRWGVHQPERRAKETWRIHVLVKKKYEWQLDVGIGPKIELTQTSFGSLWWWPYVLTSTKSISEHPCLFILFLNIQMYMINVIRIKHVFMLKIFKTIWCIMFWYLSIKICLTSVWFFKVYFHSSGDHITCTSLWYLLITINKISLGICVSLV